MCVINSGEGLTFRAGPRGEHFRLHNQGWQELRFGSRIQGQLELGSANIAYKG